MKARKAFLILAAVLAGTSVYADKVTIDQTPAAVQKAIRSRAGRSKVEDIDRDTKNGQTTYEASWKANGNQQELLVSDKGQILRDVAAARNRGGWSARLTNGIPPSATTSAAVTNSVSTTSSIAGFTGAQQAPLNWASETVQNKFKSLANGAAPQNFQKGQYQGRTAYLGSFTQNGQLTTVVMDEKGNILTSSPASFAATAAGGSAGASVAGFANAQSAPMNWASETVQNKFKQMANGAEVQNFQKGQYQGRTAYLGSFSQNGQNTTVIMGEDGTVLSSTPTAVGSAPGSVSGTVSQ